MTEETHHNSHGAYEMVSKRPSHHQIIPSAGEHSDPPYEDLHNEHESYHFQHNPSPTPCCALRLDGPVPKALAWDMMSRSTLGMSSVYLGPALLDLAGDTKIAGADPGSLLTNLAAVSGLLGCIVLPLAGSIVDHTDHRKAVGKYSAVVLVGLKALEILLLHRSTWIWLLPMQVILAVAFNIHLMATYAYLSELSSDPTVQAAYNASFGVVLYIASFVLLVGVLLGSTYLSTDDSGTAQLALAMTTLACSVGFGTAWTNGFPERPALHEIPAHQSIWTAGIAKLASTIRIMIHDRQRTAPALFVLAAVAFGEAGSAALVSVSTTFMKRTLEMSADQVGTVFLAFLLAGVPGNKLGEYVTSRSKSPTISAMICNVWFILTTAGAALLLRGPDQKAYTPIFGAFWGVSMGWIHPAHTSAFVPLVPLGCHAEWMGIYILATVALTWLPPAVFSMLNEMGYAMDVGLMSLNIFFFLAILCLTQVGDFSAAMARAKSTHPMTEMHELT